MPEKARSDAQVNKLWRVSLSTGIGLVSKVFPKVDKELLAWRQQALLSGGELSRQALLSIGRKRFHCQGGGVYSLWPQCPSPSRDSLLRLIVAFQTMSDYLDNLCDRTGVLDDHTFSTLHRSMLAALDSGVEDSGYYDTFPYKDDGGYLQKLVRACRRETARLPSFALVRKPAIELTRLYIDLQVHKHTLLLERRRRLSIWFQNHSHLCPELFWWEFAAACGSTLGVFALLGLASKRGTQMKDVSCTLDAYFPYVCGLHILLDYLIDQEEDRLNHDLNLVSFYRTSSERSERLTQILSGALIRTGDLPDSLFHDTVVLGLLAMYLSDEKAEKCAPDEARRLIAEGGSTSRLMNVMCRALRKRGRL